MNYVILGIDFMNSIDTEKNISFMKRALDLARLAKGRTFPNPAVGAVVVSSGEIAGEGATQTCGGAHAEKTALVAAGDKAQGATLYVTLEPCCHFGRTPPCTDFIIKSGIKRVFVSVKDPNPLVDGKGIEQLRNSGIEVSVGMLADEARELNEDFFWAITKKRAWVTLKLALTLDGMIADAKGDSKWITTESSRKLVHELRRCHAAVAVGRKTLELDDPQLTVRYVDGPSPARIVFSPDENIPYQSYFCTHAEESRTIVVVRGGAAADITTRSGIEFWYTGQNDHEASLYSFLEMAFLQNITSVLIEGGQTLASRFLESGFVNRVYLFYGNKLLGSGKKGISFIQEFPVSSSFHLEKVRYSQIGTDFLVCGVPVREPAR